MDLLKQELQKKRQALAEDTGGKKFFKRSEIEQKRLQKLRDEEKRELDEKRSRQNHQFGDTTTAGAAASSSSLQTLVSSATSSKSDSSTKTLTLHEQKIDDLNLPKQEVLPDDIKQALMLVVDCCMQRDYRTAVDHYIKLAIGNAPWPIGVTMVGIHERSAREKIYTNSVAHIMNDETTRKYLQSVKRLVTFCQRKYPTVPSKSIEFNSLANGSDLRSLLTEEGSFSGRTEVSEERLRLMPASRE